MERNIYRFIVRHSAKDQVLLVLLLSQTQLLLKVMLYLFLIIHRVQLLLLVLLLQLILQELIQIKQLFH